MKSGLLLRMVLWVYICLFHNMVILPSWLVSTSFGTYYYQCLLSNFTPISLHTVKCSSAHTLSTHYYYYYYYYYCYCYYYYTDDDDNAPTLFGTWTDKQSAWRIRFADPQYRKSPAWLSAVQQQLRENNYAESFVTEQKHTQRFWKTRRHIWNVSYACKQREFGAQIWILGRFVSELWPICENKNMERVQRSFCNVASRRAGRSGLVVWTAKWNNLHTGWIIIYAANLRVLYMIL
jgi:hypothetical protein